MITYNRPSKLKMQKGIPQKTVKGRRCWKMSNWHLGGGSILGYFPHYSNHIVSLPSTKTKYPKMGLPKRKVVKPPNHHFSGSS